MTVDRVIKWLLIGCVVCLAVSGALYLSLLPYRAIVGAVVDAFRTADREWYAHFFLAAAGILMCLVMFIVIGAADDDGHMWG